MPHDVDHGHAGRRPGRNRRHSGDQARTWRAVCDTARTSRHRSRRRLGDAPGEPRPRLALNAVSGLASWAGRRLVFHPSTAIAPSRTLVSKAKASADNPWPVAGARSIRNSAPGSAQHRSHSPPWPAEMSWSMRSAIGSWVGTVIPPGFTCASTQFGLSIPILAKNYHCRTRVTLVSIEPR